MSTEALIMLKRKCYSFDEAPFVLIKLSHIERKPIEGLLYLPQGWRKTQRKQKGGVDGWGEG